MRKAEKNNVQDDAECAGCRGTALPPTEQNKRHLDFLCVVPLLCGEGLRGGTVTTHMKLEWRKHLCVKR